MRNIESKSTIVYIGIKILCFPDYSKLFNETELFISLNWQLILFLVSENSTKIMIKLMK